MASPSPISPPSTPGTAKWRLSGEIQCKCHYFQGDFLQDITLISYVHPRNIRAARIAVDSSPVSVKIAVTPDPRNDEELDDDFSDCKVDPEAMKYNPVRVRFKHLSEKTSLRKLSYFAKNDIYTDVSAKLSHFLFSS